MRTEENTAWGLRVCFTDEQGKLHREDGPAIEYEDGFKQWHIHGMHHSVDGPATICPDGKTVWVVRGVRLDQNEEKFCKTMEEFLEWELERLWLVLKGHYGKRRYDEYFGRMLCIQKKMNEIGIGKIGRRLRIERMV